MLSIWRLLEVCDGLSPEALVVSWISGFMEVLFLAKNGHHHNGQHRNIGTSMPRTGITHYRSGLSHEEDQLIPNLYRYVA